METAEKESIRDIVNGIHAVSTGAFERLAALLLVRSLSAGQYLLREGGRDQNEYFVLKGVVRGFVADEVTLSFHAGGSVLTPFSARTQNGVSVLSFQALTDTRVASMKAADFARLRLADSELREFAQKVIEGELIRKTRREVDLASRPARERLLRFRQNFPALENSINHAHIASYLGITPVSLSRLRKELVRD